MIFETTLSQMAFLFFLILIGYTLAKLKVIPENAEITISKLESNLFVPALILNTFISNFTIQRLRNANNLIVTSIIIEIIVIPFSILLAKLLAKEKYTQNIYTYGLCFSNFGFMGNAIVSALFPDIFLEYIIFTLILWIAIYLWGVPTLLMNGGKSEHTPKEKLKNLLNPMFIAMIVGIIVGLLQIKLPSFAASTIKTLGDCMSPLAMLLTGITLAKSKLLEIIKIKSIYLVSVFRLFVYPIAFIFIAKFINLDYTVTICAVCSLAMPLGLNTIVIPASQGKNTSVASGMALISHLASCLTIPLVFWIFELII